MRDRPTGLRRSTLAALVAAALIGGTGPVWAAVLSQPTGIIEGRAPTVTGNHEVQTLEGDTVVDNGTVSKTVSPDMFVLTGNLLSQVDYDADGDTGFALTVDQGSATYVWKHNGTPLTAAQLSTPLYTSFPGSTVTLEVGAEVLTSTNTGSPRWATFSPILTTVYTLNVPAAPVPLPASVKFNVNGVQFAGNSGFPKTGFVGATYNLWMNGTSTATNANYTYSVDKAWVKVNAAGTVKLEVAPDVGDGTANVTVTPTGGGAPYVFAIPINKWFVNGGATTRTAVATDSYCTLLGGGYTTPGYATMTNASYGALGSRSADGRLWDEWGGMATYGSGWVGGSYWALEPYGSSRYSVLLNNGDLRSYGLSFNIYVACSRTL